VPKKTKEQIVSELKKKYLGDEEGEELAVSTTREYNLFERERTREGAFFEKLIKFVRSLGLKFSLSQAEHDALSIKLRLLGLDAEPEEIYGLGMLAILGFAVAGLLLFLFIGILGLVVSMLGFLAFLYIRDYPSRLIQIRRARASSELILSVLYLVIFMRGTSNLESAVRFVADNLETALSDDFKKLLWDVESRKYSNVKEALDEYVTYWEDYSRTFVDAVHLIESSLYQSDEGERIKILNKALQLMLEGTYEQMTTYANSLRSPINLLYMMGIMLPVLGLTMFPMLGAFLSDVVNPLMLIMLYDVGLPLMVYFFSKFSLAKRPAGFPIPDISGHPDVPPPGKFYIGKGETRTSMVATLPAFLVALLIFMPAPFLLINTITDHPQETDIYITLLFIASPAMGIFTYNKLITMGRMGIRKKLERIENEFAEATFQLGNRLSEGYPLEIALNKVSEVLAETESAEFFRIISRNITKLGFDVERAIFDAEYGAIKFYPSAIIRSIMRVAVMGARKSLESAATSLINMSSYLRDVHRIDEKVKDILSETLSSMKFQASFLAPVISGLVVGLTAMILIILDVLGIQVTELLTGEAAGSVGFGAGTWILGIFSVSKAIPLYVFQPVVGIYVLEMILLLASIDADVELAGDSLFKQDLISKLLPVGLIIYAVVAFIVTVMFTGIAKIAVVAGGSFGGA